VKALVAAGKVRSTVSALRGGAALGFDFKGILGVVLSLTAGDSHKSVTTYAGHPGLAVCLSANHGRGKTLKRLPACAKPLRRR